MRLLIKLGTGTHINLKASCSFEHLKRTSMEQDRSGNRPGAGVSPAPHTVALQPGLYFIVLKNPVNEIYIIIRDVNSLQKVPSLNQRSLGLTSCTKRSLLKCLIHIQPLFRACWQSWGSGYSPSLASAACESPIGAVHIGMLP